MSKFFTPALSMMLISTIAQAGGNGGWGGGDLTGVDEPRIVAFIEAGLKERVEAFIEDVKSGQAKSSKLMSKLIAAGLEKDLDRSEYLASKSCFRTQGKLKAQADAATPIGDAPAQICFSAPRLAKKLAGKSLDEAKRQLVALAVHEHSHHFEAIVGSGEALANELEQYAYLNYQELQIINPASGAKTITASTGDKIYGGTKLPAVYAVEEETFLPIKLGGRTYYVRPSGALVDSCMSNLERSMSFSYVSYGYQSIGARGIEHRGAVELGHNAAQQLALSHLKGNTAQTVAKADGEDFTLVPITFDISSNSSPGRFGVYHWAKTTVQYVLLSKRCADILPQVRDRLAELRQGLIDARATRLAGADAGPMPDALKAKAKDAGETKLEWLDEQASTQSKTVAVSDSVLEKSISVIKK